MPDLDLMPPGRSLHPAMPPRAGLGDVLARATRRRRRQQAGALATGAAACAAVLVFSMASGGAVDSLGVTPAHHPDGTAPTVVVPAPGSTAGQTEQGTTSLTTQTQPNDAAGSGALRTQPGAAQGHEAAGGSAATAQQAQSGSEVGPPHTVTAYDASRGCVARVGTATAQGWCGYYDGATLGRAGQRVELAESLCRIPGQGQGTLQVDTGEQAGFSVTDQNAWPMWTWSKGHRFSKKGSTFKVDAGSCLRWHVSWNVVDDAGRPLAPGAYSLDARTEAYPAGTADRYAAADAQFVTFTVT